MFTNIKEDEDEDKLARIIMIIDTLLKLYTSKNGRKTQENLIDDMLIDIKLLKYISIRFLHKQGKKFIISDGV